MNETETKTKAEAEEKEFYIIMGRSGSGKGTQAQILKSFLEKKNEKKDIESSGYVNFAEVKPRKVIHITTGDNFRELVKRDSYSAEKIKKTLNEGGLIPEFLAIWNWSNIFIDNLNKEEIVILDGAPRKMMEIEALEGALSFYNYKKVNIIYLNVSADWAIDRLIYRGREDDDEKEEQNRKMSWFETNVLPCIDLYKKKSKIVAENNHINYNFIEVNGEQSIEGVNAEIISKLHYNY
jgi:adenylate kinase